MTPDPKNTESAVISQADFQTLLRDKMCWAVRLALNTVLDAEVEAFIGAAPYARTPTRQDYRNGRYDRGLVTGIGAVTLTVPRTPPPTAPGAYHRHPATSHRRSSDEGNAARRDGAARPGNVFTAGARSVDGRHHRDGDGSAQSVGLRRRSECVRRRHPGA